MRIRLQLQHDFCMSASLHHTLGCAISCTQPLARYDEEQNELTPLLRCLSEMRFFGIAQHPIFLYADLPQ